MPRNGTKENGDVQKTTRNRILNVEKQLPLWSSTPNDILFRK